MLNLLQHAPFIYYIQFPLWNLNINNLMLINFHISLKTKRFLRSFDRHCDKTLTLSELLPNINKFRNKILNFLQNISRMWLLNCSSYCDTCLKSQYFFKKCSPVNSYRSTVLLLHQVAEVSPPSCILYTLVWRTDGRTDRRLSKQTALFTI